MYVLPKTHFSHENRRITESERLDDSADRVNLACDGPSGEALYELIDLLSISPRMVERIGVPSDAGNDDGAEFFDEVVDVHTIWRYSPVFRSKAFIWVTILSRSVIFIPFSVSSSNRSMTFFEVPLIRRLLPLASKYLVIYQSRCDQHCQMSFSRRHERLRCRSCLLLFREQAERRLFPQRTRLKLFGKLVWTELRRSDEEVSAHGRDSE